MIVLGCIKIHLNSCIRKIIVKELRVLLILHFQMQRILVKANLNIYVWSVKTKAPLIKCYDDASF
jgi:ribosomal protein L31E